MLCRIAHRWQAGLNAIVGGAYTDGRYAACFARMWSIEGVLFDTAWCYGVRRFFLRRLMHSWSIIYVLWLEKWYQSCNVRTCRLLDILADRKNKANVTGTVLVNGKRRPANFRGIVGYVVQVRYTYIISSPYVEFVVRYFHQFSVNSLNAKAVFVLLRYKHQHTSTIYNQCTDLHMENKTLDICVLYSIHEKSFLNHL